MVKFDNVIKCDVNKIKEYRLITFISLKRIEIQINDNCICNKYFKKYKKYKFQKIINEFYTQNSRMAVVLHNDKDIIKIKNDEQFRFSFNGDSEPEDNVLYFKIDNKNCYIHKYYTYQKYLQEKEIYTLGLINHLLIPFGLKEITIDQKLKNKINNSNNSNLNLIADLEAKIAINNLKIKNNNQNISQNENYININGNFENQGSELFFKCFENRDACFENLYGNLKNKDEIVEIILNKEDDYSLESYKSNIQLKDLISARIRGYTKGKIILSETSSDIKNKENFKKISVKIHKILNLGLSRNIEEGEEITNYIEKKIFLQFHKIQTLELITIKREMKRIKYKLDNYEENILNINREEINKIRNQLTLIKNIFDRCKEIDENFSEIEDKNSYINDMEKIEKLITKLMEGKRKKNKIKHSRIGQVIDEIIRVPHNGNWYNGKATNECPYWTCCKSRYHKSSCTNNNKRAFNSSTNTLNDIPLGYYTSQYNNSTKNSDNNSPKINQVLTLSSSEIAEWYLDKNGKSSKYPNMIFSLEYISGYNPNNDTMGTGYYRVKRIS